MRNALIKWIVLFGAGAGALVFTAASFLWKNYSLIMAGLFIGLFLISASWKRIRLLLKAGKAIKAGQEEIVIFYQDKNLKESQNTVIPAGADNIYFYGFMHENNDIKTFRWQGIKRALENGKEITKDDILKSLVGTSV
jgi:glucose-6-phosphate 1-dehydrogenase